MITVKVTYKGKPFNADEWAKDVKAAIIQNAVNHYEQVIKSVLTPDEIEQVTIDISERPDGNLSIKLEAPSQDVMDKINKALTS